MNRHGYIGRKLRLPNLSVKPAIILAAFGSSSRAKIALSLFQKQVEQKYSEYDIFWAYTSEIIRLKSGLPSLQQSLAQVEAAGYRKAVVQPLHIFPGTEYQQLQETCEFFPGLRVIVGETLFHRWKFVLNVLQILEKEFLTPDKGLNILALHGTPLASNPVNTVYLGLEKLVADRYPNVLAASIEGIPDSLSVLNRIQRLKLAARHGIVKIIPMMYIAGIHAEEDLMGEKNSWRSNLENMGFTVECSMVSHKNRNWFKGLAWYPEIIGYFMARLEHAFMLSHYY